MHEHIFNLSSRCRAAGPASTAGTRRSRSPRPSRRSRELKEAGYDTIVELSVARPRPRRAPHARAVEGTGLQVTLATGLYTYDVLPRLWHFMGPGTLLNGDEPLDELFKRDIEEGIEGTDIKAAMLKCAVDHDGLTEHVERVLRSCCRVHHQTDTPMTVHTHAPTERGKDVLKVLEEEGVDPHRVVLAHCGDSADLDYLEKLIDSGATLGMDRFGLNILLPFEERVRHGRGAVRARLRRPHDPVPRRQLLHRLVPAGAARPGHARLALPAHRATTCCRRCASAASPTSRSTRCSSTPRGTSSSAT